MMRNRRPLQRTSATALAMTSALASALALTGAASAKDEAGARPSYASLPEGQNTEMLVHGRPGAIPATEHAEGFHVEHPRQAYRGEGAPDGLPEYAAIYPSKQAADADYEGDGDEPRFGQDAACLMMGNIGGERTIEWNRSLQSYVNMTARAEHLPEGELIQAVRSELLVRKSDGTAELQIRDAWVDPRTTGSRLVSSQTIAMHKVKTTLGLEVFAYRGEDTVTFVAQRRTTRPEHRFITGLAVSTADGMMTHSTSECHAAVTLQVGLRIAEAAVLDTEAILPALPKKKGASGRDAPREFRVRPMTLGMSTSWTSSDDEPVLSLYAGWSGRERTQLF